MKKFLAVTLTAAMALSLASCGSTEETTVATTAATTAAETSEETTEATDAEETTAAADDALAKSEGVMTQRLLSRLSYRLSSPGGMTRLLYIFRIPTELTSAITWLAPRTTTLFS